MSQSGRCYCGAVHYTFDAAPVLNLQCHCRECQYISGGNPNVVLAVPEAAFRYTSGTPQAFRRSDLEKPATREFCATCGTHLVTRSPGAPGLVIVKRGTMDDPSAFGNPQVAIFTKDSQPWHQIADGVRAFDGRPG